MSRRIVGIGTQKHTKIVCTDEPSHGGACHKYHVVPTNWEGGSDSCVFADVSFQAGPVQEHGINGCHNEDLIAIVIDRMQYFNRGEYACRENAIAITKLEEALMWLRKRTTDRENRNVEGTSKK